MNIKEQLKLKNPQKIVERIVDFIKNQINVFNREGIVIGLSGGIDSTLSAFLCARAISPDKILVLFMPERDSAKESEKDAKLVADILKIKMEKVDLSRILKTIGIYKFYPSSFLIPRKIQEMYVKGKYKKFQTKEETTFLKNLKGGRESNELKKGLAYYRIKHRLRMIIWYFYGELKNYLIIGNCNRTEKMTGYFVKYGDSGSDIDPVAPLFKTQVKELSSFLGLPEKIIKKAPSPDLAPGITDEYALGMKFEILDQILYGLEKGIKEEEIKRQANITEKEIQYIKELIKWSSHMRELPSSPDLNNLL